MVLFALDAGACQMTAAFKEAPESRYVTQTNVETTPPPVVEERVVAAVPAVSVPEREYPKLDAIAGANAVEVASSLGEPTFKRRDAPAEIWQYRSPTCFLDLFLYQNAPDGPYAVDHIEARARGNDVVSDEECFRTIIDEIERARAG